MKEPRAQGSKRHRVLEEAVDHSADLKDVGKANGSANTTARENTGNRDLTGSYQPTRSISLLETLPSFMGLSATQSALQALPVSDVWMRLAAGYMAHAALEQSLLHGTNLSDALKEAFQWRFDPESAAEEGTDEWAINTMFFDENGEVDGWSDIKNEHIRTVSRTCTSVFAPYSSSCCTGFTSRRGLITCSRRYIAGSRVTNGYFRGKFDVFHRRFAGRASKTFIRPIRTGEGGRTFQTRAIIETIRIV